MGPAHTPIDSQMNVILVFRSRKSDVCTPRKNGSELGRDYFLHPGKWIEMDKENKASFKEKNRDGTVLYEVIFQAGKTDDYIDYLERKAI